MKTAIPILIVRLTTLCYFVLDYVVKMKSNKLHVFMLLLEHLVSYNL